ncbi:competence type IV pilus ATPase ComGA [Sporosarcina trichiuri]|uniref:competence type IV pilus ATPase ComGA n=1 Tax=Sporosarcina trichiuri TaxID=3056445 RepID=UPI0025B3CEA7|nr:competence type IV pilus ATPase ComGA [Sporosarcina sp. 0.2-SM1T-5]WJY28460.1 competence type IV pilus ATPase ComGA [Sporosarcina sp. 0.2-SM1T-5]
METQDNLIEQKCFQLLQQAIGADATDIHMVPSEQDYDLFHKKGSRLERIGKLPPQLAIRMISFYKYLSSLDISDRRKPQSGSFHKQFSDQNFSFRISTIPSIHTNESAVIRIQQHNKIVSLDQLCLDPEWSGQLKKSISQQQGLFMVTGPTGSGKTTTIYSLTAHCVNELGRHVITLEDPVENPHRHLLQIQVNERAGMSYAAGLKAILRHSPDVIMIGEIRDAETAKVAVQAALTGHLVLTTVHAKDAAGCLYRMMDFGVSAEELRQTAVCISAQRLIRKSDGRLGAVFEIIQDAPLEELKRSVKNEEPSLIAGEGGVEALVRKYSASVYST